MQSSATREQNLTNLRANPATTATSEDLGTLFSGVSGEATFTLFQVDQNNILGNDDRPQATAAGFFSCDAGEERSLGIEFDVNLATESGFNLCFSCAYVDAEFTNRNPDSDLGAPIEKGDPLINAPENQLNIPARPGVTSGRASGDSTRYTLSHVMRLRQRGAYGLQIGRSRGSAAGRRPARGQCVAKSLS